MSDDPQAVIEEMLGEVEGLDAESQRAQFAELIAADAFSQVDDDDPDPALNVRGRRRVGRVGGQARRPEPASRRGA